MTINFQWFDNYDITGKDPKFKCVETIKLTDKTLPFIVPNRPPFYAEGIIVRNQNGVITNVGWKPSGELPIGIEYTGKQVVQFLELDDNFLNNNSEITITYQALCMDGHGRQELKAKYDKILHDRGLPIDWKSQVGGKPDTYPFYRHLHENSTEIRGWEEIIYYCRLLVGTWRIDNPNIVPIEEAVRLMKEQQLEEKTNLYLHDGLIGNQHGVSPEELGVDKIDNYPLASVEDDINGIRNDAFSTPAGAVAAVQRANVNVSKLMESDGFPISLYGRSGFVQPSVSTGMSVLGSKYPSSAMCLEDNGELVLLSNRCDGRINRLYYSRCFNFKAGKPNLSLTSTYYTHPTLTNDNVNPNYVIGGSNCRILMIGNIDKNKWYCTLTNGTLNSASHLLTSVDTSAMTHFNPENTTVHLMKDWVYLFCAKKISGPADEGIFVYRFKSNLLTGSGVIVPEYVRVNYETLSKVKFVNMDCFVLDNHSSISEGCFDSYVFKYEPQVQRVKHNGCWQIISAPLNQSSNLSVLAMFVNLEIRPFVNNQKAIRKTFEFIFEFDTNTNTFKVAPNNFFGGQTVNPEEESSVPRLNDIEHFNYELYSSNVNENTRPSSVILNNGMVVTSFTEYGGSLGIHVMNPYMGDKSPFQILSLPMTAENFGRSLLRKTIADFESPNGIGNLPSPVFYTDEGEMFRCRGWRNGVSVPRTLYREVTGDYAKNQNLGTVISGSYDTTFIRPLTDKVIEIFDDLDGIVGLTGNKAKLAELGLTYGKVEFSANSMFRNDGMWYDHKGHKVDSVMVVDTLHTKKVENESLKIDITAQRNYPYDAFRSMIQTTDLADPSNIGWEERNIALTVFDFSSFGLPNLDHVLVVSGNLKGTLKVSTAVIFFDAKFRGNDFYYGVPTKTFNYIHMLKSLNSDDVSFITGNPVLNYNCYAQVFAFDNGNVDVVVGSDNCYFSGGYKSLTAWYRMTPQGEVSEVRQTNNDCLTESYQAIFDKCVCETNYELMKNNGFCLGIYKKPSTPEWYITISPYLFNNLTVFFNSEEPLMINGNQYTLAPGTIYLPDVTSDYLNKTFYLYATVINGVPQYLLATQQYKNTNNDIINIGTVVTNDIGVVSCNIRRAVIFGKTYISGK